MTNQEMQHFISDITATWPQLRDQWQSPVYAETLRGYLQRHEASVARVGLQRWVEQHNRPPTVFGLLGAIDQVQDEQRQREARTAVAWPDPEAMPEGARDVAKEALTAIYALLDQKLEMIPIGGYRRTPEELQAYIRSKGLTNYGSA